MMSLKLLTPAVLTVACFISSIAVSAQADPSDKEYAMTALTAEARDIGEKMACHLKIYVNGKDPEFLAKFGKAYEQDMSAFSNRVEAHVAKFAPHKDRHSIPIFRFNTWHNLSFFIDEKASAIREAPDQTIIGRCNIVAASTIQRLQATGSQQPGVPGSR